MRKLKQLAGENGVSMEKEHRRLLRESLFGKKGKPVSFKEYLLQMPNVGSDEVFKRRPDFGRKVKI